MQSVVVFFTGISSFIASFWGQVLHGPGVVPYLQPPVSVQEQSRFPAAPFPDPTIFSVAPEKTRPLRDVRIDPKQAVSEERYGKPSDDFGPPQPVLSMPLSIACDNTFEDPVRVMFNRAYLTQEIPDLNTDTYDTLLAAHPDIGVDRMLVVEGTVFFDTEIGGKIFYADWLLRLKRGQQLYRPYGGTDLVWGYTTGKLVAVFPAGADETQFTLHSCALNKPTVTTLDFSHASKTNGVYTMEKGFVSM